MSKIVLTVYIEFIIDSIMQQISIMPEKRSNTELTMYKSFFNAASNAEIGKSIKSENNNTAAQIASRLFKGISPPYITAVINAVLKEKNGECKINIKISINSILNQAIIQMLLLLNTLLNISIKDCLESFFDKAKLINSFIKSKIRGRFCD